MSSRSSTCRLAWTLLKPFSEMIGLIGKKLGQTMYDANGNAGKSHRGPPDQTRAAGKESEEQMATTPCNSGTMISRPSASPLLRGCSKTGREVGETGEGIPRLLLEVNTGDEVPVTILKPAITSTPSRHQRPRISGRAEVLNFGGGPASYGQQGCFAAPVVLEPVLPRLRCRARKCPATWAKKATVQNLEVIQVRKEDGVLLIKGAIPGSKAITWSSKSARAKAAKA